MDRRLLCFPDDSRHSDVQRNFSPNLPVNGSQGSALNMTGKGQMTENRHIPAVSQVTGHLTSQQQTDDLSYALPLDLRDIPGTPPMSLLNTNTFCSIACGKLKITPRITDVMWIIWEHFARKKRDTKMLMNIMDTFWSSTRKPLPATNGVQAFEPVNGMMVIK